MFLELSEREKHHGERETLMGFLPHRPQPEAELATYARALAGNQTCDLLVQERTLQPTEPLWPWLKYQCF